MPPSSPFRFPTRHYPYQRATAGVPVFTLASDPLMGLAEGTVAKFFLGADGTGVELLQADLGGHINDPFARLVLMAGHRPRTLLDLLAVLNAATGAEAVPGQRLYRVADGGQIPWDPSTETLNRLLRLIVTRHRGEDAELFIATAPPFDAVDIFLQVFAWDPVAGAFNFYERRSDIWVWAGSSWQALEAPTRGLGPFDSHVNGGPVMKELKVPWMHWHSQGTPIQDDILAPADPLRTDSLYQSTDLKGAEDLELIVRAGIARWTRSRFEKFTVGGVLQRAPDFLRHLLTTTTVNLTSALQPSASLQPMEALRLPTTFFVDSDRLVTTLGLTPALPRLKTQASFYQATLQTYDVRVQDESGFSRPGDTHFAFAVPEPAFEDEVVLQELLSRRALSKKLAACLLMVDFPNPVFSLRREALLRYVPGTIALDGGADLDHTFVDAVIASLEAADSTSVEAEFLELWRLPDTTWEAEMVGRLEAYWTKVQVRLATAQGFDDIFRLSESRRHAFSRRPLAEFKLTVAIALKLDLPVALQMTADALVQPVHPS
jgi:hypothetical protein